MGKIVRINNIQTVACFGVVAFHFVLTLLIAVVVVLGDGGDKFDFGLTALAQLLQYPVLAV